MVCVRAGKLRDLASEKVTGPCSSSQLPGNPHCQCGSVLCDNNLAYVAPPTEKQPDGVRPGAPCRSDCPCFRMSAWLLA